MRKTRFLVTYDYQNIDAVETHQIVFKEEKTIIRQEYDLRTLTHYFKWDENPFIKKEGLQGEIISMMDYISQLEQEENYLNITCVEVSRVEWDSIENMLNENTLEVNILDFIKTMRA